MELRCTPDRLFSEVAGYSCDIVTGGSKTQHLDRTITVDHLSVDGGKLQMFWPGPSGMLDKEDPAAMTFDCSEHSCKVTYGNELKHMDLKLCKDKQETTATFFEENEPIWRVILQE